MTKEKNNSEITLTSLAGSVDNLKTDISEIKISLNNISTTIDDLAIITANSFKEINSNLNSFKKEMYEFKDEMYEFRKETKAEFKELHSINNENGFKLKNHERRICKVETELQLA